MLVWIESENCLVIIMHPALALPPLHLDSCMAMAIVVGLDAAVELRGFAQGRHCKSLLRGKNFWASTEIQAATENTTHSSQPLPWLPGFRQFLLHLKHFPKKCRGTQSFPDSFTLAEQKGKVAGARSDLLANHYGVAAQVHLVWGERPRGDAEERDTESQPQLAGR